MGVNNRELYEILAENLDKRGNLLATVIEGDGCGAKVFFSEGELLGETGAGCFSEEEKEKLCDVKESGLLEIGSRTFFAEVLRKPCRLVICGGGHVAQQVIVLAKRVGFQVTVLEDRPFFADQARAAGADEVICDRFDAALERIPGGSDTYFLVVTRGHRYDGVCLEKILRKERAYTGMMASRRRGILLKRQMVEEGLPEAEVEKLKTPVGLNIHAETPEEIAVSIIAEVIAVKNSIKKTSGYDKELLEYLTGKHEDCQNSTKNVNHSIHSDGQSAMTKGSPNLLKNTDDFIYSDEQSVTIKKCQNSLKNADDSFYNREQTVPMKGSLNMSNNDISFSTGGAEPSHLALATIISRRGSAPREIGTKMLVLPDGKCVGTLGGGCMESRIQHQCLRLLHESAPQCRLIREDMTGNEAEEEGLVCGGTIQVFIETL